jgi:type IV secretion system protein VirB1
MLSAALLACAIGIAPSTLEAVISVESGGRANITRLNKNGTTDYGLMQVNSVNLPTFQVTPAEVMDPCTNLRIGSAILQAAYADAVKMYGEGQRALMAALSAYNTGDFEQGFHNGYVARYYGASSPHINVSLPKPIAPAKQNPYKPGPGFFVVSNDDAY